MIIPASITPHTTAIIDFLKSIFRNDAAKVPVHAPVPGSGIPTNKNKAKYKPLPADSYNFLPPFSPLFKHQVKNLPIIFLSFPHNNTLLANK